MLTRDQAQEIRDVMALELRKIGHKYGFQIRLGKLSYKENDFRVRVTGERVSEKPLFIAPIQTERQAVGRKFRIGSRSYEVIGVRTGGRKYTLTAQRLPDGKRFRVSLKQVQLGAY